MWELQNGESIMNIASHEFLSKDEVGFSRQFSDSTQPAEKSVERTVSATHLALSKPGLGTLLLGFFVLLSGLAIIYVADLNRQLNIEWQNAQAEQNQLHVDWGKLLLEETTWSTQARIQTIAQTRLGMQMPTTKQIVMVTTHTNPILASRD